MLKVDCITNSIFNSRTYILSEDDSDEVWLVDCGDIDKILEKIGGKKIKGVLLTHAHFDHIYGLPELLKCFSGFFIYTNEWGTQALSNDRLNLSRYHGQSVKIESSVVKVLKDGEIIYGFRVYETPGHNPSCLCYGNSEMFFAGDSYIPGVSVVTGLPNSDKKLAKLSAIRISSLVEGKTIFPGHTV